jgi:hypothetical protein
MDCITDIAPCRQCVLIGCEHCNKVNHRTSALPKERERLTVLPLAASRGGRHLPLRRGVVNGKVSFELRSCETLILKCLRQERPFLIRTERGCLPV